jgi:ornithine cyclodeaminase/alanine dehydrogenase-like protein (mu-crystallin family)
MSQAIEAMRRGFQLLSDGGAEVPLRTFVPLTGFDGSALFMPAYAESTGSYAVKVASIHKTNPGRDFDAVQALVLLFDADTGRVDAVLEGRSITAIRTGAGSGLATDLMARKDAKTVAIFGSGTQARSHLGAVAAVRDIERAYCLGRSLGRSRDFADHMSQLLGIEVVATTDLSVVKTVDIICTTTTANKPLIGLEDIANGVHINAVGTHRPDDTEISADIVLASRVVVDQLEACLQEAGEIILPIRAGLMTEDHIFGEIGEIASGSKPGRESDDEITLFKSVGNAIQDLVAARSAVVNARRLGLGTPIVL